MLLCLSDGHKGLRWDWSSLKRQWTRCSVRYSCWHNKKHRDLFKMLRFLTSLVSRGAAAVDGEPADSRSVWEQDWGSSCFCWKVPAAQESDAQQQQTEWVKEEEFDSLITNLESASSTSLGRGRVTHLMCVCLCVLSVSAFRDLPAEEIGDSESEWKPNPDVAS